jgi:hypothetical protein
VSDTAIAQEPIEPAVTVLPAPDLAVELDATPEVEHPIGPLRQALLDHLLDSEGPQTVAQILAGLGGTVSGNTCESVIRRAYVAGEVQRVAPGTYRLAPPKPAESPKPAAPLEPEPDRGDEKAEQERLEALERDRVRKRLERQRDREAALARQAEADQRLRNELLNACRGNYAPRLVADDLAPIKAALALGVGLDVILGAVRNKVDRLLCPTNEAAASWMEKRLLEAIAQRYCRYVIIPSMLSAMEAAGKTPQKPAEASEAAPAVPAPPAPVDAPAASPANGIAPSDDDAGELGSDAAALMKRFGGSDVEAVGAGRPDVTVAAPAPAAPDDGKPVAEGRQGSWLPSTEIAHRLNRRPRLRRRHLHRRPAPGSLAGSRRSRK